MRPKGPAEDGTIGPRCWQPPAPTLRRTFFMDSPAGYLHLGVILISYPNLLVIGLMIVLFAIALVAPFHGVGGEDEEARR